MALISTELTLFLAVAEAGGFSAAARKLGVSPSTAARRIEAFEQGLGTRLFKRSTRGLGLTEAGRALVEEGGALAVSARALADQLSHAETQPSGLLRVTASTSFGRRHIAPRLGAFRLAYPQLRVELRLEDGFVDLIETGLDMAIRIGRLPDSTLRCVTLGPVTRRLCASPEYLSRRDAPRRPADLGEHDCIVVGQGVGGHLAWRFQGGRFWPAAPAITVSTPDAAVAVALGGAGLAHLPSWLVAEHLERGDLIPVLAQFDLPPERGAGVHLVWPERPPAKTTAFAAFLKEELASLFR
jgi:DNA-binding transcriptional LysR family regulator